MHDFQAQAILLKNNFKNRQDKNLPLREQILSGNLSQDKIKIYEGPLTFEYDTKNDTDLFPLSLRPIRHWLHEQLETSTNSVLLIGIRKEQMISQEKLPDCPSCQEIPTTNLDFSQITENLRELSQASDKPFRKIVMNQFPVLWNQKNKTALFHIYYQILKLLENNGDLFVKCENWSALKQLIHHVGKKLNRKMSIREKVMGLVDFPSNREESMVSVWIKI